MSTKTAATVEDLYQVDGKAELVNGELVYMNATGYLPGRAGGNIQFSLLQFEKQNPGVGRALPDNVGFLVDLPHRKSFSPDVAFHTGPTTGMKFLNGAPDFAVEIRSEGDYGPVADREILAKIRDYFDTGTIVVWDVDLLGEDFVRFYHRDTPAECRVFRKGDIADAEPAVKGWQMQVDEILDD